MKSIKSQHLERFWALLSSQFRIQFRNCTVDQLPDQLFRQLRDQLEDQLFWLLRVRIHAPFYIQLEDNLKVSFNQGK